jgi:hypothetical protein
MTPTTTPATCLSCGENAVGAKAHERGYDYCEVCYYNGRAEAHRNDNWLAQIGPDVTVWQTGGGCQNPTLTVTNDSGEEVGHVLLAMLFGDDPTEWEVGGGSAEAHPVLWDYGPYFGYVGEYTDECAACARIYAWEEQMGAMAPADDATAQQVIDYLKTSAMGYRSAVLIEAGKHTTADERRETWARKQFINRMRAKGYEVTESYPEPMIEITLDEDHFVNTGLHGYAYGTVYGHPEDRDACEDGEIYVKTPEGLVAENGEIRPKTLDDVLGLVEVWSKGIDHWREQNRKPIEIQPTYHGIVRIQCRECSHIVSDRYTMEVINDLEGLCPKCESGELRFWNLDVIDCSADDDNGPRLSKVFYGDAPLV